ncbi:hypothetical protein [Novosphingobium sp. SG707]|uniref:hypothetical protein n=1 Tax=Novosphingobium sp. SG707 TaxID=2586996 RepID=UPI00144846ED|nr:hypothetical protein [Novosphingobium sp. SG707]
MDNPVFADEPASEREAWERLIAMAAHHPMTRRAGKGDLIEVARGQLHSSERTLAGLWKWDRKRVGRFLKRLEKAHLIGTSAGPSGVMITIENYDEMQNPTGTHGANRDADNGANQGPSEGHTITIKQLNKENTSAGGQDQTAKSTREYAFQGAVIRLTSKDLDRWAQTYHAIPDLKAELTSLDAWLTGQPPDKRNRWFHTVSGCLNRKHQEATASRAANANGSNNSMVAVVLNEKRRREAAAKGNG